MECVFCFKVYIYSIAQPLRRSLDYSHLYFLYRNQIKRKFSINFQRLVQYPLDDIIFSPEGPAISWCGVETRRCQNCSLAVDDSGIIDHWSWCGTRIMSMRMATRLQRLAVLTNGNGRIMTQTFRRCIVFYISRI